MHGSKIAIWFFIGILLVIYGALITGSGAVEWITGKYPAGVELTNLHATVWWGAVLFALGLFYVIRFRPGADDK